MLRQFLRLTLASGFATTLGFVVASCSSDAPTSSRPVGQGGTGGGGSGSGGQGGTGGSQGGVGGSQGGVGGTQGGTGGGPTTTCPTNGAQCCGGLGNCVPTSCLLASQSSQLGQDVCTTTEACAPSDILSGQVPATCRSVADAEGRCASTCIPLVAVLIDRLPQGACDASHRCAPCYNPIDGQPTGICSIGTDTPNEPAYVFQNCGNNRGKCVPANLVPPAQSSLLPQETCDSGYVCAPTEALLDPNFRFPSCTSTVATPTIPPAPCNCPGACVPKYLADSQTGGTLLLQDNCTKPDDRCAPCTNPANQQPSGACL